jgi:amino acid transporter
MGLAMVFVLLTYGGWNDAAYISAEVRGGARAILRTLVLSIAIITIVYVAFVASIWYGLGFEALKASKAIGVDAMEGAFGPIGGQLIGTIVAISALTSMNSTMIVGARTNYSVARDWPVFGFMAGWRGERNLPAVGFLVQTAISLALIVFGMLEKDGFATMVEFTAPVFWFFFMLSGISLFVLRRKHPTQARPFSVPLYPILPLIFVVTCAYLFYSSITYAQSQNAGYVAIAVVAAGAVVLLLMKIKR